MSTRLLKLTIDGMTCASCTTSVTNALATVKGVLVDSISISHSTNSGQVVYNSADCTKESLMEAVFDIGFDVSLLSDDKMSSQASSKVESRLLKMTIDGMTCASCTSSVTNCLKAISGVYAESISISHSTNSGQVEYNIADCTKESIMEAIYNIGFEVSLLSEEKMTRDSEEEEGNPVKTLSFTIDTPSHMKVTEVFFSDFKARLEAVSSVQDVTIFIQRNKNNSNEILETTLEKDEEGGQLVVSESKGSCVNPCSPLFSVITNMFAWFDGYDIDDVNVTARKVSLTVSFDEESSEGMGTRMILHLFQEMFFSEKDFNISVSNRGGLLLAARNEFIQSKEKKKLGRNVLFALLFTIPLFIISMGHMDDSFSTASKSTLGKMLMPGLMVIDVILFALCTPVQFISGYSYHLKALHSVRAGSLGMHFLISTGTMAAYFYSVGAIIHGMVIGKAIGMENSFFETAAVLITVVLIGQYLELYACGMTTSAINKLMNQRSRDAILVKAAQDSYIGESMFNSTETTSSALTNAEVDSKEVGAELTTTGEKRVAISQDRLIDTALLQKDDIIRVIFGKTVPADGMIVEGSIGVDESMLTGESAMVSKEKGQTIYAGTMIVEGSAEVSITAYGDDSTLGKIISAVQETLVSKPAIEEFANIVATYFVPVVTFISFATFFTWLIAGETDSIPDDWYGNYNEPALFAFMFALAVWVSACPCAFGLATSTAVLVCTGVSATFSVLIRRGAALQSAASVNAIAFDKTGTLTLGEMTVTDFLHFDDSGKGETLFRLLYEAERRSNHPLAKAITNYCITLLGVEDNAQEADVDIKYKTELVAGKGLHLRIDDGADTESDSNIVLSVGSSSFVTSMGIDIEHALPSARALRDSGKVAIFIVHNSNLVGLMGVADTVRPEAPEVIRVLHQSNVEVYMVTGDEPSTALAIANAVGIPSSHILASALPNDKETFIRALQERKYCVAFVGDGTNDANALARADVGIALGGGTDIAIDTGDIILVKNDLSCLLIALDLSYRTFRRIILNYFWALIYNICLIPIAAGVLYPSYQFALKPMYAGIAMAASSVSIVLSSLTLYLYTPPARFDDARKHANYGKIQQPVKNSKEEGSDEKNYELIAKKEDADVAGHHDHGSAGAEGKEEDLCKCPASTPFIQPETHSKGLLAIFSISKTKPKARNDKTGVKAMMAQAQDSTLSQYATATINLFNPAQESEVDETGGCQCGKRNCKCGSACKCGTK